MTTNRRRHERKDYKYQSPVKRKKTAIVFDAQSKKFKCRKCSESLAYQTNGNKHERLKRCTTEKVDNKICPHCKKVFAKKLNWDRHVDTQHYLETLSINYSALSYSDDDQGDNDEESSHVGISNEGGHLRSNVDASFSDSDQEDSSMFDLKINRIEGETCETEGQQEVPEGNEVDLHPALGELGNPDSSDEDFLQIDHLKGRTYWCSISV